MAKPATAAKPAVKKAQPAEHVEVNTDHVRPGAVGDYEHQSEEDVIKAAAKDHEPGEGENIGQGGRPGLNDLEDA